MGKGGDRQGKVMLAKHPSFEGTKGGESFTLGVYRAGLVAGCAKAVALEPDSTLTTFPRVDLAGESEDLALVAEMVTVV
jgi:hypothetical protein